MARDGGPRPDGAVLRADAGADAGTLVAPDASAKPCAQTAVDACAGTQCSAKTSAADRCILNSCGFMPSSGCIAQSCAAAFSDLGSCVALHCGPCSVESFCSLFCQRSVSCGFASDVSSCTDTCLLYDILYPAACGAVTGCDELAACNGGAWNRCGEGSFACATGTGCIPIALRCDSTPDCADGSDEGGVCQVPTCAARSRLCGSSCVSCPSDPSATRFACDGATCIVASCSSGTPNGDHCDPIQHSILMSTSSGDGVAAAAIGSDSSLHLLLTNDQGSTRYYSYATNASGIWTVEPVGLPAGDPQQAGGLAQLLLSPDNLPKVVAVSDTAISVTWQGASGWDTETYAYTNGSLRWRAAIDPSTKDLLVALTSSQVMLRRSASGWSASTTPCLYGGLAPSNMLFAADGPHLVLAGLAGSTFEARYLRADGYCNGIISGPLGGNSEPLVTLQPNGEPAFAIAEDLLGLDAPATLLTRSNGSWSAIATGPLPDAGQQLMFLHLAGSDATRPFVAASDFDKLFVSQWTGSEWTSALPKLATGRFADNYYGLYSAFAASGQRWVLAIANSDAKNTTSRVDVFWH